MAYSKFPKVCWDAPFGIRGIAQLDANVQAVRDLYNAEHFVPADGEVYSTGPGAWRPGQHDTPLVPRTVGVITVASQSYAGGAVTWFLNAPLTGRLLIGVQRLSAGVYLLQARSGVNMWCEAYPVGISSAPRKMIVRPTVAAVGVPGFTIQALELNVGWDPVDYSFHFALNAESA